MKSTEDKILKNSNILIIIPENPKVELLSAVFGFSLALEALDKEVSVISDNSYKKYPFLKHPKNLSSEIKDRGDFFISINTENDKIKELRYEKSENEIKIHLDPENEKLKKEAISIKFSTSPYDLILVFGAESESQIENFYKKNIDVFSEIDIEFINKEFYSDFILDLIYKIKAGMNSKIATNLFTSTFIESKKPNRRKDSRLLKIMSYLLKARADYPPVIKHFYKDKIIQNRKIAEIILKNISYLKKNQLFSKIPYFEFEKLKLSSNELISAIIETRLLTPSEENLVVLIEPSKENLKSFGILGIFISDNKKSLDKFSKIFNSSYKKNFILFSVKSDTLKNAESKIIKLLNTNFD